MHQQIVWGHNGVYEMDMINMIMNIWDNVRFHSWMVWVQRFVGTYGYADLWMLASMGISMDN